MRCRYNAVNFLTNIRKRHPIARPLGRGMGCLLWIQHLIDTLSQFLQLFMQYLTILDRVITALHCIYIYIERERLNKISTGIVRKKHIFNCGEHSLPEDLAELLTCCIRLPRPSHAYTCFENTCPVHVEPLKLMSIIVSQDLQNTTVPTTSRHKSTQKLNRDRHFDFHLPRVTVQHSTISQDDIWDPFY